VVGGLVALGAWLFGLAMDFNEVLLNSPLVRSGFSYVLSFANLFFILIIIVIGIATILQKESYGMKQLLWKLVLMALLVNFGFVIADTMIGLSNSFTKYFLKSTDEGYSTMITNIVTAFQPQALYKSADSNAVFEKASGKEGFFTVVFKLILNIFFVIIFLALFAFTLIVLAVLMLLRALWLSFLIIILPFAWVSYALPALEKWWSDWWGHFLRWAFFAPIVTFFIFLTLTLTKENSLYIKSLADKQLGFDKYAPDTSQTPAAKAAEGIKGVSGVDNGFVSTMGQMILILGFLWGGMFAANAMGLKGAEGVLKGATAARGWVQGKVKSYAARKGKQAASFPLRTGIGKRAISKLQSVGAGGGVVARTLTKPVRYIGHGLEAAQVAGGEKEIQAAGERLKGLTTMQKINRLPDLDPAAQMAVLMDAEKEGLLRFVKDKERYLGKDKADLWNRYNQGYKYFSARGASGVGIAELVEDISAGRKSLDDLQKYFRDVPNAGELMETFFQDFDKAVQNRMVPGLKGNDIEQRTQYSKIQEYITYGLRTSASPTVVSQAMQKATRASLLQNFSSAAARNADLKPKSINDFDPRIARWIKGQAAAAAGVDEGTFGLRVQPEKAEVSGTYE